MKEKDFDLIDDYDYNYDDELEFGLDDLDLDLDLDMTITNEYLNSFIWNCENIDNRFNRYVKQFKQQMFEAIKNANLIIGLILSDSKISSIDDYMYNVLWMFADNNISDNKKETIDKKAKVIFEKIAYNLVKPLEYTIDDKIFMHLVLNNREIITQLINIEFKRVCEEIIGLESSLDEDITEYNFVKYTLPENEEEYIMYYNQIIFRVCENFDNLIMIKKKSDVMRMNEIEQLKEELSQKEKKIFILEKDIDEKTQSLNKLRKLQEKTIEEKNRAIKNAIMSYKQENANLNKKLRLMEKEMEKIKKESVKAQETVVNEGEKQEQMKEIDYESLNILFVSSDSSTFINDFKKTFPNSKIVYDNFKVDFSKYDFVIVITTHIDHMTYNTMKDKCKNAGTKFLHCTNTNVEKIKELIAEKM